MRFQDAFKRAVRTAFQTAAGVLVSSGIAESFIDANLIGDAYLAAVVVGVNSGVISFLFNVAEDNTGFQAPK